MDHCRKLKYINIVFLLVRNWSRRSILRDVITEFEVSQLMSIIREEVSSNRPTSAWDPHNSTSFLLNMKMDYFQDTTKKKRSSKKRRNLRSTMRLLSVEKEKSLLVERLRLEMPIMLRLAWSQMMILWFELYVGCFYDGINDHDWIKLRCIPFSFSLSLFLFLYLLIRSSFQTIFNANHTHEVRLG